MPVISNCRVSQAANGGMVDVAITWDTDVAADGTVVWSQGGTALGRQNDPNYVLTRSITIPGLAPSTDFTVLLASSTERGQDCGCDAVNPGSNCTVPVTTVGVGGPADAVILTSSAQQAVVGQTVTQEVQAGMGGSPDGGRSVRFSIHNGDDRGSFAPNPATTGGDGRARTVFTPAKNGKAQIRIDVDGVGAAVDVIVN
jgi:hypothetical protein